MKIRISLVLVPLLLACATGLVVARSTGPLASSTGAPALGGKPAEKNCNQLGCHTDFSINLPGATLQILDLPATYWPDSTYTIRVRMTSTFAVPRRWGFQMVAIDAATGDSAGTLLNVNANTQVLYGAGNYVGRRYIEHTLNGTYANNNGPVEWSVRWRAPHVPVARVIFCAAGNAANNSDSNTGDHIYTTRDTTDLDLNVGVPVPAHAGLALSASPNPSRGGTRLTFTLPAAASVSLDVLDVQGRVVRALERGERAAGTHVVAWDGRRADGGAAAAGVYFARLALDGGAPRTLRLVLER